MGQVALAAALLVVVPFALACSPLASGTLTVTQQTVELIDGERHVMIRVSPEVLTEATSLTFQVVLASSEGVESVVLLPDSPDVTGVSVAASSESVGIWATANVLDGLRCDADGICEVGFTVIVVPSAEETEPTEVDISLRGWAPSEQQFSGAATAELEVDGEAPVLAERGYE